MEYSQYVVTTLTKGVGKIGPIVITIVVGYFLFIKLPFLFFRKGLKDSKENLPQGNFQKVEAPPKEEPKIKEEPKKPREEKKKEPPKKKEEPKPKTVTDEEIFGLRPGEKFTQDELKKRYRELLKGTHPDKVAALDPDFKKLADKKTKEINTAYEKLKSKAT